MRTTGSRRLRSSVYGVTDIIAILSIGIAIHASQDVMGVHIKDILLTKGILVNLFFLRAAGNLAGLLVEVR